MILLLAMLFVLSFTANIILVWYVRKVMQNLRYGVNNVDEMQKLLEEYAVLLQPLAKTENYYADPALTSAINNTNMVVDMCRAFKKTLLKDYEEIDQEAEGFEEEPQATTQVKTQATIKGF